MKRKLLNGLVILTSLLGYLEWGGGNSMFLWQAELEVLSRLFSHPLSAAHPLTLLPLLGQVLLLGTLFQKVPSKVLTIVGIACLALLLVFIFLIGAFALNYLMLFSAVPFMVTGALAIKEAIRK